MVSTCQFDLLGHLYKQGQAAEATTASALSAVAADRAQPYLALCACRWYTGNAKKPQIVGVHSSAQETRPPHGLLGQLKRFSDPCDHLWHYAIPFVMASTRKLQGRTMDTQWTLSGHSVDTQWTLSGHYEKPYVCAF